MDMKKIVKIIAYIILLSIIAILSALLSGTGKQNKILRNQVSEQSKVIDSLLTRRMTVYDITLNVTDRSTNKINGKFSKGIISMPQVRTYRLEIDSVNFSVR